MANFKVQRNKRSYTSGFSFNKDEEIDEGTRSYIDYLLEQEVNGLYLTGSTGEAF